MYYYIRFRLSVSDVRGGPSEEGALLAVRVFQKASAPTPRRVSIGSVCEGPDEPLTSPGTSEAPSSSPFATVGYFGNAGTVALVAASVV